MTFATRAQQFVREIVLLDDGALPEDLVAFDEWARLRTLTLTRVFSLGLLVCCVVYWPLDRFIFSDPGTIVAMNRWRWVSIAQLCAGLAVLSWAPGRRHPALVLAALGVGISYATATVLGEQVGPGRPLLYGFYLAVLVSLAFVGPIVPRSIGTLGVVAVSTALYLIGRQELLSDVVFLTYAAMLAFAGVCAIIAGHMTYVPMRQGFLDRRALARLTEELDLRVQQKSADLVRLTEHLQVTEEEERSRIARELDDELDQRLSALHFALANTRQRYGRNPTAIGANIAELDSMIDGALECARGLVTGLRPAILDKLGLAAAVEWLAGQTGRRADIACRLDIQGQDSGVPAINLAAFRVAQEALSNTVRHAGAQHVDIRLELSPKALFLQVVDDGCGFPESVQGRPADRNGLLGMYERADALGGSLQLDNVENGGARVRLSLPFSPQSELPN